MPSYFGSDGTPVPIETRRLYSEFGSSDPHTRCACSHTCCTGLFTLIGQMLARMAVETERIAELFRKEHRLRNSTVRYYRFNVPRGLEDVGLEETENIREVAAVTRQYIKSSKVEFEVRECMGSITNREGQ